MRRALWLATLLLPLGGCYAPTDSGYAYNYGYTQPGYSYGYAQPGYVQPSYGYGYAPSPYDDAFAYPGYSYNNGAPTIMEGGVAVPLVLYGGEWGYYDHGRHWHRAPDSVNRHLHERQEGGFHGNRPPPGGFNPPPSDHYTFHGNPGAQPPPAAAPPPDRFTFHGNPGFQPAQAAPPPAAPHANFAPARPAAPAAPPPAAAPHYKFHGNCPPGQHC